MDNQEEVKEPLKVETVGLEDENADKKQTTSYVSESYDEEEESEYESASEEESKAQNTHTDKVVEVVGEQNQET
jgi:hypothetical protein